MTESYISSQQLQIQNHLAVLPCGDFSDNNLLNWTDEQLRPYLFYTINGQNFDTMFGGLVFNIIRARENHYIYPMYTPFGEPPEKVDWQMAIDNLFKPNFNFDVAAKTKLNIDIWVSLPYPHPVQKSFGEINGKILNFTIEEDRLAALQWWINTFLELWKKKSSFLSPLIFRGFVWQRESIDGEDIPLVKKINSYIHLHHLLSLWLPNYGAAGLIDWKGFAFDAVCVNPNYYGNTNHDYQWINNAALFAKYYQNGIQIYYGKGLLFNDTHLLEYLNLGLPEHNNYVENCLLVYQFPNQTLKEVAEKNVVDYIRIYSFMKKIYTKVFYPGIPY